MQVYSEHAFVGAHTLQNFKKEWFENYFNRYFTYAENKKPYIAYMGIPKDVIEHDNMCWYNPADESVSFKIGVIMLSVDDDDLNMEVAHSNNTEWVKVMLQ